MGPAAYDIPLPLAAGDGAWAKSDDARAVRAMAGMTSTRLTCGNGSPSRLSGRWSTLIMGSRKVGVTPELRDSGEGDEGLKLGT